MATDSASARSAVVHSALFAFLSRFSPRCGLFTPLWALYPAVGSLPRCWLFTPLLALPVPYDLEVTSRCGLRPRNLLIK